MYRKHFGLTHSPLGKQTPQLFDDGQLTLLQQRFHWLLESPGIGLLTGEAGVGKTAALRSLTATLNPHRYQVIYLAETDFGRLDLYRNLAVALGNGEPEPEVIAALQMRLPEASAMVAEHIRWALERLSSA